MTDIVLQFQEAQQKLVAELLLLRQDNRDLQERLQAAMAYLSPPAIPPIAEVPNRDVTHIETDEDLE